MTGNQLKTVACISMAVDHVGFILFPKLTFLRYIGRIAMPLFAYCIAEGCRHTRSKPRYFFQVFGMALFCQAFFLAEGLMGGGIRELYLNILFTFSLAMAVCFAYMQLEEAARRKDRRAIVPAIALFAAALAAQSIVSFLLEALLDMPVRFDYGISGMILPLFGLIFTEKRKRDISFGLGTVIFCLLLCREIPYVWFSLLALPLILLYNGKRGKYRLKTVFYMFYPLHFAVIYGIKLLI